MNTILLLLLSLYVLGMSVFMILENRRPQATLAWLLAFFFLPVISVLIYVLFGRDQKAFSKQSKLLMQDLEPGARPLLSPLLTRQDEEIVRLEGKSTSHKHLMTLVRRNSRSALTRRNRVDVLQDARAFYPRMVEDMKTARRSIHLQYFIWRADEFTERLKDILCAKAEEGVEVRLLYDPMGSRAPRKLRYSQEMRAAGIDLAPTSPLWRLHTISYRNHRKITVVDGRVGYIGGMNIGQEHLDGPKGFDSWRDTQLRIAGPGAAVLQAVFAVDWYNAVREDLFSEAHFPADVINSLEPTGDEASASGNVPVQILTSGPDSHWAAIRQLYTRMIETAERHVVLQSPYFVLDAHMADALTAAALSGVDVRVMLSARPSGNPLPAWAGNTYMADVAQAGVQVFLYQRGYLHAKTISTDSRICSVGSANVDIRSFSINYELNAVLYDERLARELEAAFERDLAGCTAFDVEEYRSRSAVLRLRDSVARLFSPLL